MVLKIYLKKENNMKKYNPKIKNHNDEMILSNIDIFGYHVVQVMEDENNRGYSFTLGFENSLGSPEICILNQSIENRKILIDNLFFDLKNNNLKIETEKIYRNILEGFGIKFVKVDIKYYENYFGILRWLNCSDDFIIYQMLIPDMNNNLPDTKDYDKVEFGEQEVLI